MRLSILTTIIVIGTSCLGIAQEKPPTDVAFVNAEFQTAQLYPSLARRNCLVVDMSDYVRPDAETTFKDGSVKIWKQQFVKGSPSSEVTDASDCLEGIPELDEKQLVIFFGPSARELFGVGNHRFYVEFSTVGKDAGRKIIGNAGGRIGFRVPTDPFATFSIDGKVKADHVLSKTLSLATNPPTVIREDKRDVWQFDLKVGADSIGKGLLGNLYLRTDSKISQFQIDPESKLRFSLGTERAQPFMATRPKFGQFLGFGERLFFDVSFESNQALKNQQWVLTLGHEWSPSLENGGLKGEFALDHTIRPRPTRDLYQTRLRAESIWKYPLPVKLFSIARDSLYFFAEGKAWYSLYTSVAPFNAFGQRINRLETWGAFGLAIPVAGPVNGNKTHLKIYYRTGANPDNLYEKQAGVNFEVAIKF